MYEKTIKANATNQWLDTFPNDPVLYLMTTRQWVNDWVLAKIGVTTQLPFRHHRLEMQGGRHLKIDHCVKCPTIDDAKHLEKMLHNIFGPAEKGEYFWLNADALRIIRQIERPNDLVRLWHDGEIQHYRFAVSGNNRPRMAS